MRSRRSKAINIRHVIPMVAGVLLTSCASVGSTAEDEPQSTEGVEVRVVNSRTQDIDIYVLSVGASRDRIGRVPAAGRGTLLIPMRLVEGGGIALLAQPRGYGDPLISREIVIALGDVVEWHLENNLALSTLTVSHR